MLVLQSPKQTNIFGATRDSQVASFIDGNYFYPKYLMEISCTQRNVNAHDVCMRDPRSSVRMFQGQDSRTPLLWFTVSAVAKSSGEITPLWCIFRSLFSTCFRDSETASQKTVIFGHISLYR